MSKRSVYVTTAIPYVNGDPHLGHALELVQADVLARHRRLRGDDVRFLTGTDDNASKNALAAEAAGVPVAAFVDAKAARFVALRETLELSNDDFIRTSRDPRHRRGVERLWRSCVAAGDLYERDYEGLYCTGCEAFLTAGERDGGKCYEHRRVPERVAERNWFFRLSRYRDALLELVETGCLRIEPRQRRHEVVGFLRSGLEDFSVSRSAARARGWGIPVPGDPDQVVYVWFDALANYVTALDYGADAAAHARWWTESDERIHTIGKGIVRFHAVYWPAILLSAGERLPSAIYVHDYVTVEGRKLSKSLGDAADPESLVARYGVDALRWWVVRDVPLSGDVDFRAPLLAARGDELADGVGNLVNRTIALVRRFRPAGVPAKDPAGGSAAAELVRLADGTGDRVDAALSGFDLRAAAGAVWHLVVEGNRFVSATKPWELAKRTEADAGEALDVALGALLTTCETIARELTPFLPGAAVRIEAALAARDSGLGRALFAKASS